MSIISANTLFHFTHTKDTLLKILETGFRPSYCREFGVSTDNRINESHVPMVCFCDLPLSFIEKHSEGYVWIYKKTNQEFKGYGRYAVGLSKDWGQKSKLNPVTYVTNHSHYLEYSLWLNTITNEIRSNTELWDPIYHLVPEDFPNPKVIHDLQLALAPMGLRNRFLQEMAHSLFSYLKPYKDLKTGQRYYDEREWRYVIPYNANDGYKVPVLMANLDNLEAEMKKFKQEIDGNSDLRSCLS